MVALWLDSGYLLGGGVYSGLSGDKTENNWDSTLNTYDFWVVKVNSKGVKQWDKRFGGIGDDGIETLTQTSYGSYVLAGISTSDSNGDKTQNDRGGFDYWLVKIDSAGNKIWDRRFGGSQDDLLYAMQPTSDAGYIMGGTSYSDSSGDKTQNNWGGTDYWVVKVDSIGNKQWDKRFGGLAVDDLRAMVQAKDGGYLLGGTSTSGISGDKTVANWVDQEYNYWIVKVDSAGNKLWDKRFGGLTGEFFTALINTKDNGFLMGGYSYSGIGGDKTQANQGDLDYWIVKIDSAGNKLWDKDYGGSGEDDLTSLSQTNDGGYLISGDSQSPLSGDKT